MSEKPLFDIEGKVRKALSRKNEGELGLEQTGEDLSVPQEELPEPSKVEPSEVEKQPPKEAAGSGSQTTSPLKQDYMKPHTPKQRTRNYERFTQ